MSLGEQLYRCRKDRGLSQEQLAEKIEVTRQTISNWELGETAPNPEQLKRLSREFRISIDALLENEAFCRQAESSPDGFPAGGEEKTAEKSPLERFVVVAALICAVIWLIAGLITIGEGHEALGIVDLALCVMWAAIAWLRWEKGIR